MTDENERDREIKALRDRLSKLSEASLRINASLDYETVLQGVLDSARALTYARYGVMVLIDDTLGIGDLLSSGLTPDESNCLWTMPEGPELFESLRDNPGQLRHPDIVGYARSLDLPEFSLPVSVTAALWAPILYGGEEVGYIFVAKSDPGREFSREDEETLVMFASQAALVLANAQRYQEEKRTRLDLETLVDTSPVGVVVFDVKHGKPVSINREARRIVKDLLKPGQKAEQLLQLTNIQRADGREFSLQELTLTQALSVGETVRAEEIVFHVPDGRSVRALLNATPVCADDGEMAYFVVTLQDMTPLDDLDRLRIDFLAMVSHELWTPLAAVKGVATTALADTPNHDAAETSQFFRIIDEQADLMRSLIRDLLDVARIETGTLHVSPEPMVVTELVERARSAFLSGVGRNHIHIDLPPHLPYVLADSKRVVQVLGNLFSNASRYSSETAPIRVTATEEGVYLAICVADRGRGISPERLPRLFRTFTRQRGEDETDKDAESGWGLAICRGIVEAHGGRIWAKSEGEGMGMQVTFTLPIADDKVISHHRAAAAATSQSTKGEGRRSILVVDDDPRTLRSVRDALADQGYAPLVTGDPDEVPGLMEQHRPDLVLLDLVLPGTDGVQVMTDVISDPDIPVIFISAYGHDEAIARAFDAGADDYVIKPFSPTELAARIRAALRKRETRRNPMPEEPFVMGDLKIDYTRRDVAVSGRRVRLTNVEYRLLAELSVNAGKHVAHDDLLRWVWKTPGIHDRARLRTAVKNIRRKLGDDADNPTYIFNEPGKGYRLGADE